MQERRRVGVGTLGQQAEKEEARWRVVAVAAEVLAAHAGLGHEIDRVIARSGTQHKTPLLNALLLEPDVVYFLTDGDRPRLTTDELRMVKKTNRSRARIHVVEFAVGPREERQKSWLELLAQQSGGVYRRINLRP